MNTNEPSAAHDLGAATTIADLALRFARVNRATFRPDGERPESDVDHTVMLGLLAVDIAGKHRELGLDPGRLCALALVHDLPEVFAGDTDTTGGLTAEQQADKSAREAAAIGRLYDDLGNGWIMALVTVYEQQEEPEARFLRYLDKILPKLTHTLNGCAAIRRAGHSVEWLRARHAEQGAGLRAEYPEFAAVLGPLFDAACAASEAALAAREAS